MNSHKPTSSLWDIFKYSKSYFVNPIERIKSIPIWSWQQVVFFAIVSGALSGSLKGILSLNPILIFAGILIFPIIYLFFLFLFSYLFYYFFLYIYKNPLNQKLIFTILVLSTIPYLILRIGGKYVPPLEVIGFGFAALLIIVGFVENFKVTKKSIIQLVGAAFLIYFLFWSIDLFKGTQVSPRSKTQPDKKSIEILQQELAD